MDKGVRSHFLPMRSWFAAVFDDVRGPIDPRLAVARRSHFDGKGDEVLMVCGWLARSKRTRSAVNFDDPKFTAARLSLNLVCEERTRSTTDLPPVDSGKYVASVEERQPPVETSSVGCVGSREVDKGSVTGISSGHSLEIVDAESDRVRRATCCAHIGCHQANEGGVRT